MLKETVKYEDYNGIMREEDYYFNLNEAEIIEMAASQVDLAEKLRAIVAANDGGEIMRVFHDFLRRAYGEKSEDGRRFVKRDKDERPLFNSFRETEAYNKIFMRLVTEPDYAAKFIEGVLPKDLEKKK